MKDPSRFAIAFLLLIATLGLIASGEGQPASTQLSPDSRRPNIIWLIAEDVGTDFGCYGDPSSRTPNLDKFASQGCMYRQAHSTGPVCSTSRSALITGMYQTSFGAQNHRSHRDDGYMLPPGIRLITDRLRDVGYFTANVVTLPAPIMWKGAGKTDYNFNTPKSPFDSAKWEDLKAHQPFYAQVNFHETHRNYEKAEENPTDPATVKVPPYLPDNEIARADWAVYHDAINELDAKVGQVLDLIDKEGLGDNTLIFFFGDHGRECFRGKYYAFEQGTIAALLARWPGHLSPGTSSDDLVSFIDITATSLSAAGIALPPELPGIPFIGPDARRRQYLFTARDRIDETLDHVRTVRDDRYKLTRNYEPERPYLQPMIYAEHTNPNVNMMKKLYAEGKLNADQAQFMAPHRPFEELYDLKTDPWEFHNLATLPEYRETLTRMETVLDQWRIDTNDKGLSPEDPVVLGKYLDRYMRQEEKLFANGNNDPLKKPAP